MKIKAKPIETLQDFSSKQAKLAYFPLKVPQAVPSAAQSSTSLQIPTKMAIYTRK